MDKHIIKEMRKRRKMFPWLKAFCSKYSEKFLDSDKSEALHFLLENIDSEVNNLILEDNMEKAQDFFHLLNSFFLHFWWQIRWKSLKTWKKYWKKGKIFDATSTSMQKECCVKLLHGLVQISIFLSKDCLNSDWVDRVLITIKLVPGFLNISYDALLLLNNLKKKHMLIYCVILKHLLFGVVFETITVPVTYIKVILLFRRLLKFTKDEKEKDHIKFLATKLKPPTDIKSWLLSLNIGSVKKLDVENMTQDLLSRPFPDEFLRKLTEALNNERLYQNAAQVVTTKEGTEQHTLSNEVFSCDYSFSKKKEDSMRTKNMTTPNKIFPKTNFSTCDKSDAKIVFMETISINDVEEKQSENEGILSDNLLSSQEKISRKRANENNKDKNDLIKKSKKEHKNAFDSGVTNTGVTKLHKKKINKSKKYDTQNHPKLINTSDKNQSQMSNYIHSDDIAIENEKQINNVLRKDSVKIYEINPVTSSGNEKMNQCEYTSDVKENISQVVKTHKKKSKKSKKHKKDNVKISEISPATSPGNEKINQCEYTSDVKVNVSEVVKRHKKKKESKKSKKHKKEKEKDEYKKNQSLASSVLEVSPFDLNESQIENNKNHSNEKEIYNHIKRSVTKKLKSPQKNLATVDEDKNFTKNQSDICNLELNNYDSDSATANCLENSVSNCFKQTDSTTNHFLEKTVLKKNNCIEDLKEKSKPRRKKLFNIETHYCNKNQGNLIKIPSKSNLFQESDTMFLNKSAQHEHDLQVSKTIKKKELPTNIDDKTSNGNEREEITNLTITSFEKDKKSADSDNMDSSNDSRKSSTTKELQESVMSSDMSISELLKITPVRIYRNNKVFGIEDCEQSCFKTKSRKQSTTSSKSEDNSDASDTINLLKINKIKKKYDSQNFSLKPFPQSMKKTIENKLLYTSKKILKQTYTYEHCSSPSLFDEEIASNYIENVVSQGERTSSIDSNSKMQPFKQNWEANSNDEVLNVQCDGNSLNSSIHESTILTLESESSETQSFDSICKMQQLGQDCETYSNEADSDVQCDRNSLNLNVRKSSTLTLVTESSETHSVDSEYSVLQCGQNGEKDFSDTSINVQCNENSSDSTIQESSALTGVTESSQIHSVASLFQHQKTDIINQISPIFLKDTNRKPQTSDHTNCCINLNNGVVTSAINPHLHNLSHVITKDVQKSCSSNPVQQFQLTEESKNYIKSNYSSEESGLQSLFAANTNQNEMQNNIFENSHDTLNQINRNENNIFPGSANESETEILQNAKNKLMSTNNYAISSADSTQPSPSSAIIQRVDINLPCVKEPSFTERQINQNVPSHKSSIEENRQCIQNTPINIFPKNKDSGIISKDPSTCIIDCRIVNNHSTNNNSDFPDISSMQVIINLNNKNGHSSANKVIANFDFQSSSKSCTSSITNLNPLHHIPSNNNVSSCRTGPSLEIPIVQTLNSNKSSLNNACQFSESSGIPNCDNHQNSLNLFNTDNANNCHKDNMPSILNFLCNDILEKNPSHDVGIQTSYVSDDEMLRDANLNNKNLNNSLSFEYSISEELNIINAKKNPNTQNHINDERPSKRLKPLSSGNVSSLNKQTKMSPSITISNPGSSYRTSTEIYSDLSEDNISVSTVTNISDDEFNSSELVLESPDSENRCINLSNPPKQIMSLPSFETFQQSLIRKSSPKNRKGLIVDDSNNSKKDACNECSTSNTYISKSTCSENRNSEKSKRRAIKIKLYSESQNTRYNLRSRESLQKPERFEDL